MRNYLQALILVCSGVSLIACTPTDSSPPNSPEAATSQTEIDASYQAQFGVLTEMAGRRLRGTPTGESSEVLADIQEWSWGADGRTLLIRHALEDGSYGGDTEVKIDPVSGDIIYHYQPNADFETDGRITLGAEGRSWMAREEIGGGDRIVQEVESRAELMADDTLSITSRYRTGAEWQPGHAFIYIETDQPLPELKARPSAQSTSVGWVLKDKDDTCYAARLESFLGQYRNAIEDMDGYGVVSVTSEEAEEDETTYQNQFQDPFYAERDISGGDYIDADGFVRAPVRIITPDNFYSTEYEPYRLNIVLDADEHIENIACG